MKVSLGIHSLIVALILSSCGNSRKSTHQKVVQLNTLEVDGNAASPSYQSAYTKYFDLLHTKLDVQFDLSKEQLFGKAEITVKPHFYSSDSIVLDAKEMDIHSISMNSRSLRYEYNGLKLKIFFDKKYTAADTLILFIDYTSNPSKIKIKGSAAISEDRGLYFINPDGKEKDKPVQIWTQGETESNSVWFPTIESGMQRMTQEICMTVDTSFLTLSNGLMDYSLINPDGTRTDCWKQNEPMAPYLTMMTVGKFSVVKDFWRGKEVNYYVESEFEKEARAIFGRTPEMLEFFSNYLKLDYPGEKYSQVVVRDYVSGAMENNTAVIHGEFLQQTTREMLDGNNEDVISHELFHHWFGNLTTCESWSNLPLNESFATYGEYLWNEYKYGRMEADRGLNNDLVRYLGSSRNEQKEMIRYYYEDREDMFDVFSYQKGGRILHMLRKYVGDSAFVASLHFYLKTNQYSSVEIHHLRMAFEKITGEDLNWFFNQWFLEKGHPELNITHRYDPSSKKYFVQIKQTQSLDYPTYRIPMDVDIYAAGKMIKHKIILDAREQEFAFPMSSKPDLVNVDAEKMLLGTKREPLSSQELLFKFRNAPLFMDRLEVMQRLPNAGPIDSLGNVVIAESLKSNSWKIRELGVQKLSKKNPSISNVKSTLLEISVKDENSHVRGAAIETLGKLFGKEVPIESYQKASEEPSYLVAGAAIEALLLIDSSASMQIAEKFRNSESEEMKSYVGMIYGRYGDDSHMDYFLSELNTVKFSDKFELVINFGNYLTRVNTSNFDLGLSKLDFIARNEEPWWMSISAIQALENLKTSLSEKQNKLNKVSLETNRNKVLKVLEELKKSETDEKLLKYYDSGE